MDQSDSNKRLKSSSGTPIPISASTASGASRLPAYQPPPQMASSGANRPRPSASVSKPVNGATSLRLTVKAPPSKLRQATSGSAFPPNPYAEQSESDDTPAPPVRTARATRNPKVVVDPDSDEDEEEEEEDAEGEDMDDEEDAERNEDSEVDAEGEEDEDMDDHPPPPVIKQQRAPGLTKPHVTVMPPHSTGPLKSVEDKEMDEEEDEDEDLSELDSNDELGNDMDENEEEEGDELDSESDQNSRSVTPDLTKLTKRQRGALEEDPALMALSNEALKKKHLTAEEHVQRRAEMARRRKNLSEKRNEEEKMETINKLLQKQAPKRRTRAEINAANAAAEAEEGEDDEGRPRVNPVYTRWVQRREGSLLGVPREWIDAPIGEVFRGGLAPAAGRMVVEEVV